MASKQRRNKLQEQKVKNICEKATGMEISKRYKKERKKD